VEEPHIVKETAQCNAQIVRSMDTSRHTVHFKGLLPCQQRRPQKEKMR